MNRSVVLLTAASLAFCACPLATAAPNGCGSENRVIELAICLDTSGSMDGLLNSARQKLWTIVNDLAKAGPTPTLRVALLSYGNDGHNPENGWVKSFYAFGPPIR